LKRENSSHPFRASKRDEVITAVQGGGRTANREGRQSKEWKEKERTILLIKTRPPKPRAALAVSAPLFRD